MSKRKSIHDFVVADVQIDFIGGGDYQACGKVEVHGGPTCTIMIEDDGKTSNVLIVTEEAEGKEAPENLAEVVRHYAWAAWHKEVVEDMEAESTRLKAV